MSTELAAVERETAEQALLACSIDTPREVVAEMVLKVDGFVKYARDVEASMKKFMREYVEEHGTKKERKPKPGEEDRPLDPALVVGATLYTVGHPKDVDCPDQALALDELFQAVGGDFKTLASYLSANAFKPGAVQENFPDVFVKCFKVTWPAKLEKDDKPSAKALQKFDLMRVR